MDAIPLQSETPRTAIGDQVIDPFSGLRKAAGYVRVSLTDQSSLADQLMICQQAAFKDGFYIPDDIFYVFADDDVSGKSSDRKAFTRLIDLIRELLADPKAPRPFSRIYVKDRTRFGRWKDPRRHGFFEVLCEDAGVKICYCNAKTVEYEVADEAEVTMAYLLGSVESLHASSERRKIVSRTRGGTRSAAAKGRFAGSMAPYGTERRLIHKLTGVVAEVVPPGQTIRRADHGYTLRFAQDGTRTIVEEIFRRFEEGEPMRAIAADLVRRKIRPPGAVRYPDSDEAEWTGEKIRKILVNPVYIGDSVWDYKGDWYPGDGLGDDKVDIEGDGPIIVKNAWPDAPVSRERWANVQRRLRSAAEFKAGEMANRADFPVSAILKCDCCGSSLYGYTKKRKDGTIEHRYYRHNNPERHEGSASCPYRNVYVRADEIEPQVNEIVLRVLSDTVLHDEARAHLTLRLSETEEVVRGRELDELRENLKVLRTAGLQAGRAEVLAVTDTERETYHAIVADLSTQQDALKNRIDIAVKRQSQRALIRERLDETIGRYADCQKQYLSESPGQRKEVVRKVFEKITVNVESRMIELHVRVA